ncbi:oligosaccharide flippase family protein, partial [Escherichia coli]|uniref:oligosaccharide flippase family protein n=1 Tax=Escherichia coli TaxID=562 RepID=UPI001485675B
YTTTTVVVLGFICGPVSVGYFNAANTIRNAAQSLMKPIYQAVYPRINSLFEDNYAKIIKPFSFN